MIKPPFPTHRTEVLDTGDVPTGKYSTSCTKKRENSEETSPKGRMSRVILGSSLTADLLHRQKGRGWGWTAPNDVGPLLVLVFPPLQALFALSKQRKRAESNKKRTLRDLLRKILTICKSSKKHGCLVCSIVTMQRSRSALEIDV